MGGIDEKTHLLFCQHTMGTTAIAETYAGNDADECKEIDSVGPFGSIPWGSHRECDGLGL